MRRWGTGHRGQSESPDPADQLWGMEQPPGTPRCLTLSRSARLGGALTRSPGGRSRVLISCVFPILDSKEA